MDQKDLYFFQDAVSLVNINPRVVVNIFTINNGVLQKNKSYELKQTALKSLDDQTMTQEDEKEI